MKLTLTLFMLFLTTIHLFAQDSTLVNPRDTIFVEPHTINADLSLIQPPEGFVVSEAFNGYIHYQMATAIIMTMIENANYVNIEKGMTQSFYDEKGLTFISKEKITTTSGLKGLSYKLSFTLKETEFIRYMVYVGDLNNTLWLNITYPKMADELLTDVIMKVIQSAQLTPRKDEE